MGKQLASALYISIGILIASAGLVSTFSSIDQGVPSYSTSPQPCTTCSVKSGEVLHARLVGNPSLSNFDWHVQQGRGALIAAGRNPAELIVIPDQEIRWTHPGGELFSLVFDEADNLVRTNIANTSFFHSYFNGVQESVAVMDTSLGHTAPVPLFGTIRDASGRATHVIHYPSQTTLPIGTSSSVVPGSSGMMQLVQRPPVDAIQCIELANRWGEDCLSEAWDTWVDCKRLAEQRFTMALYSFTGPAAITGAAIVGGVGGAIGIAIGLPSGVGIVLTGSIGAFGGAILGGSFGHLLDILNAYRQLQFDFENCLDDYLDAMKQCRAETALKIGFCTVGAGN
ncbi:MAG: hypothetical protein MUC92_02020 [Fimbriimonadaceae bacterium]|jgi:hypothetical protein|nr:hypothetical protein [Fimbriimonadaceae bacterium]